MPSPGDEFVSIHLDLCGVRACLSLEFFAFAGGCKRPAIQPEKGG